MLRTLSTLCECTATTHRTGDMKVLVVTRAEMERGRGPVRRLLGVPPYLSWCCDVTILALDEHDAECSAVFHASRVCVRMATFHTWGWYVMEIDSLPVVGFVFILSG